MRETLGGTVTAMTMGPAQAAQALRENGGDAQTSARMVGVGLYGFLMMARRGDMDMKTAREMVYRLLGAEQKQA